jgi:hypothetical protein
MTFLSISASGRIAVKMAATQAITRHRQPSFADPRPSHERPKAESASSR